MRDINGELARLNYPPNTKFSPLAMGLGDPAFLARNIVVDNWDAVWGKDSDKKIEDCTTYANTAEGDAKYPTTDTAKARINPTTDVMDILTNTSSMNVRINRDFGSTLSDTAYVNRKKITLTDLTLNTTVGQACDVLLGMSNSNAVPNTAQDFIGLIIQNRSIGLTFRCASFLNGALNSTISSQSAFAATPTTQDYYIEDIRSSATAFGTELFSNEYVTPIEAETITIDSGVDALQFWKSALTTQTISGSGAIAGTEDDFRLADGVTTPP